MIELFAVWTTVLFGSVAGVMLHARYTVVVPIPSPRKAVSA